MYQIINFKVEASIHFSFEIHTEESKLLEVILRNDFFKHTFGISIPI